VFAVMTGHVSRSSNRAPVDLYWLLRTPTSAALAQLKSPLIWDVFAISTYLPSARRSSSSGFPTSPPCATRYRWRKKVYHAASTAGRHRQPVRHLPRAHSTWPRCHALCFRALV